MKYNLFDSHAHSDNSFDGTHSATFMCETAIQNGLLGIAITDHCDIDMLEEQHFLQSIRQSYFEVRKAQAIFGDGFVVTSGMEIGQPDADYALAQKTLNQAPFDFILGSVHTVGDKRDLYYMNFAQEDDPYEILALYFERLYTLVKWNLFDVLGHITYPLRYLARDGRTDVTLERYDDLIDECLRLTAQNGKGIEINTSGLRQELGDTMPSLKYLRRFRELGGEIITLGSDAHRAEFLGCNIADGMELAGEAGFRYFSFFKGRQPRMMPIY